MISVSFGQLQATPPVGNLNAPLQPCWLLLGVVSARAGSVGEVWDLRGPFCASLGGVSNEQALVGDW